MSDDRVFQGIETGRLGNADSQREYEKGLNFALRYGQQTSSKLMRLYHGKNFPSFLYATLIMDAFHGTMDTPRRTLLRRIEKRDASGYYDRSSVPRGIKYRTRKPGRRK